MATIDTTDYANRIASAKRAAGISETLCRATDEQLERYDDALFGRLDINLDADIQATMIMGRLPQ